MRKLALISGFLLFAVPAFATHTCGTGVGGGKCFVDFVGGSDAATGATTSVPWKHLPGMAGASGNASSQVPIADDVYVLKGGVSWTNAAFPITWAWSGTSGHPILITIDLTYFTGGSWTRPIFNAGGVTISTNNDFVAFSGAGSYTTWNNIEWTGMLQLDATFGHNDFICISCASGITNVTVTNNYFHNWSHGAQTSDEITILLGSTTSPFVSGSLVDSNVADNSDGDGVSGEFLVAWSGTITHNIVKNTSNGILPMGPGGEVAFNNIGPITTSFDVSAHENAIETLGGTSPAWNIHDNLIHDGTGESMMLGNTGETDIVWNNVTWNWTGNAMHFAQNSGQTGITLTYWNNIIIPNAGNNCFVEVFSPTITTFTEQNNHCITTAAMNGTFTGITTLVNDHNLLQTPTVANGQGYTSAETFVYSPSSGGNGTVGAGTNLTSSWPGGFTTNDTTYACTEISGSGGKVVSCPGRTFNTRPGGGAWDIGAYEFAGSTFVPVQESIIMLN